MSRRSTLTTQNSTSSQKEIGGNYGEERSPIRCLKAEGPQSVWLMQQNDGRLVTVKREKLSFSLFWRSCLRITNAQRQERGSKRLQKVGISTPEILSSTRFRFSSECCQELVLEYVSGENAWDFLSGSTRVSEEHREIAGRLGDLVALMVKHGLRNRDFKLENIILSEDHPPDISLIDTVGVRRSFFRVKALAQMLERIIVQPYRWRIPVPASVTVCLVRHALQPFSSSVRTHALENLRARLSRLSHVEIP